PTDANALPLFPCGNTGSDFVDDARDFMSGNTGKLNSGPRAFYRENSLWQTPQACTLIRTCPASGVGISRSTTWRPSPGLETCAAFMVPIATCAVAINPPVYFSYCRKTLFTTGEATTHRSPQIYPATSKMTSSSMG